MTAPAAPRVTKPAPPAPRPVARTDEILLELIDIGDNVRTDPGDLAELQASIAEVGVLQPVKVTEQPDGRYHLVWGQRRVLACRALGRLRIPAYIIPAGDVDAKGATRSIEQLAENLIRKDLNPIEEAVALREVLDADPTLTQDALADRVGMSRPWVSKSLGLLEAAPGVQALVRDGRLTPSHVSALRGLAPKTQVELAEDAVERGYSAHQTEQGVQQWKRSQEWDRDRRASSEAERKARVEGLLTALAKKKVPTDAVVHVTGCNWVDAAAAAIRKAGYTNVVEGTRNVSSRTETLGCDCTAWLVRVDYATTITGACVVEAHRTAKRKADSAAYDERHALGERVRGRLAELLVDEIAGLGATAARVMLWRVLGWEIEGWAKAQDALLVNVLDDTKPKRKKVDPWTTLMAVDEATIRTELAKRISSGLRDGNFKVGWEAFAEQLGVLEAAECDAKFRGPALGPTVDDTCSLPAGHDGEHEGLPF